jgi:hypothetical protein
MDANQAKANADRKAYREDLKEMRTIIKAWSSDLEADGENRKETMACQEKTEARLEEDKPASVDRTPEVTQEQEVSREDAVDMPVGEPRKRRRDRRNLAAVRRQKKKDQNLDARRRKKEQKRTLRKNGCGRNLFAARRGTTRRVQVARRNKQSTVERPFFCWARAEELS